MRSSSDGPVTQPAGKTAAVVDAYIQGWRRAVSAPGVVLAVWLLTTLVSLPLAMVVRDDIASHLESSLASDTILAGWDQDWTDEFAAQASGVSATFTREILGGAGSVAAIGRLLDGERPPLPLVGAIAAYLLVWIFLSGGVVDRLARARPVGAASFIALCGRYASRLLRLAVGAGVIYWLLFAWVHPVLFDSLFDNWTRDLSNESHGLLLRAALYLVFALLLVGVSLIVDFTRVRLIVEDRHSVLASTVAAIRFVRRRFGRCVGLYALNLAGQAALLGIWIYAAGGAVTADWLALLVAQIYLLARIWARLAFLGSEAVLFQRELAHAGYTAAPLPLWPDSASVEAIRNLRQAGRDRHETSIGSR